MKDEYSLEARFYDKVWGQYDYNADVKFLDSLFRKNKCRSIVDVGCGTANHSIRLSKLGYEVTGVDVSPSMLTIARKKGKKAKIRFVQNDMKRIGKAIFNRQKFDAAICLGQVFSHLMTDNDVQVFLKGMHKILKSNGIFVFSARNARKISEEYLNRLCLDHSLKEAKLQLLILAHNTRDSQDPNTIVWKPIYLIKENDKIDFQIREHKLRWFMFSLLKKIVEKNRFRINGVFSGPQREKFRENEHLDMWFLTTKE